jgi:hypothetical protein
MDEIAGRSRYNQIVPKLMRCFLTNADLNMSPKSVTELASALPNNLRYLATLIARKPKEFSLEWASTANESFSLYTRTSTVNLILAWNNCLSEPGWPFPSYLDLHEIINSIRSKKRRWYRKTYRMKIPEPLNVIGSTSEQADDLMTGLFHQHAKAIFHFWRNCPLLKDKISIIDSISATYNFKLFAACMPTTLALLDFVMRDYFETDNLNVSLQTLSNAFNKAGILPKHLMPGSGIWDLIQEKDGSILFPSLEQDLRLPGVFLSSFVEFGNSYYGWYSVSDPNRQVPLNRHAIMHCAGNYWSLANTTKLLSYFDLTLRLERVLKIIIHGPEAASDLP